MCSNTAPLSYETNRFGSASGDSLAVDRVPDPKYSTVRALGYDQKLPAKKRKNAAVPYVPDVRSKVCSATKFKSRASMTIPSVPSKKRPRKRTPRSAITLNYSTYPRPWTSMPTIDSRLGPRNRSTIVIPGRRAKIRSPAMVMAERMNEQTPRDLPKAIGGGSAPRSAIALQR
jgi:hypothetical protein